MNDENIVVADEVVEETNEEVLAVAEASLEDEEAVEAETD